MRRIADIIGECGSAVFETCSGKKGFVIQYLFYIFVVHRVAAWRLSCRAITSYRGDRPDGFYKQFNTA